MIHTLIQKLKNFKQIMSYGGITNISVSQLHYGNALKYRRILISGGVAVLATP